MKLIKSRKFWMAIAGVGAVVGAEQFGLSQDTIMKVASMFVAYLLGQGMADFGKEGAGK